MKEPEIELVKSHIVTDDVARLATFYATLVRASVVLNDYYVEVPAGAMSVEFSLRRFTEYREDQTSRPGRPLHRAEIILDFQAGDVDAEYERIAGLGVDWVTPPGNPAVGEPLDDLQRPRGEPHQCLLSRPGCRRIARPGPRCPPGFLRP